jgi:hypothetical protein
MLVDKIRSEPMVAKDSKWRRCLSLAFMYLGMFGPRRAALKMPTAFSSTMIGLKIEQQLT